MVEERSNNIVASGGAIQTDANDSKRLKRDVNVVQERFDLDMAESNNKKQLADSGRHGGGKNDQGEIRIKFTDSAKTEQTGNI